MNKRVFYATTLAAIFSTTTMAHANSLAISVANDDAGIFQPSLNALYGHQAADRGDYTAGLFLGYSYDLADASQVSFHIAQDLYSPSGANKRKPYAVIGDRAFSAFLHTGVEWNTLATNWLRYRLGTDIGVIGPDAGGQDVQNRAHRIIGAEKYPAWQDQIENRYGYTAKGMVSLTPGIDIFGVNLGIYPEVSAVGGNLFQYLGYGATLALGNDKTFNSDNGFGLLARRGLIHSQKEGLIYKLFAGIERREVDKNYTLQGKTQQTKMETVELNKTVDEYRVGATVGYSPVAFSLSLNKVTSEFRTADDYSYINGDITFFF